MRRTDLCVRDRHPEQNDDMDEDEEEEEIARPQRPLPVQSRAIPNGTS